MLVANQLHAHETLFYILYGELNFQSLALKYH